MIAPFRAWKGPLQPRKSCPKPVTTTGTVPATSIQPTRRRASGVAR